MRELDCSFLSNAPPMAAPAAIVEAVLHLASRLGVPGVAEGIETECQLATQAAAPTGQR